jgi:hypothetical protein
MLAAVLSAMRATSLRGCRAGTTSSQAAPDAGAAHRTRRRASRRERAADVGAGLQRRLAETHVSYRGCPPGRCDAAERHLAETALSIAEVSWRNRLPE